MENRKVSDNLYTYYYTYVWKNIIQFDCEITILEGQ